jgi:hypothetical protein
MRGSLGSRFLVARTPTSTRARAWADPFSGLRVGSGCSSFISHQLILSANTIIAIHSYSHLCSFDFATPNDNDKRRIKVHQKPIE